MRRRVRPRLPNRLETPATSERDGKKVTKVVLRNAHVIDPAQGIDRVAEVAIDNGRIAGNDRATDPQRLGNTFLAGRLGLTVVAELSFLVHRDELKSVPYVAEVPLLAAVREKGWSEHGDTFVPCRSGR